VRTRSQNLSGIPDNVVAFGVPAEETMTDDPDFSRKDAFKPLYVTKTRVLSNPRQTGTVSVLWNGSLWIDVATITDSVGCAFHHPIFMNAPISAGGIIFPDMPEVDFASALKKYGKSDVQIGVFLAELRDTVNLFYRPWTVASLIAKHGVPSKIKTLKGAVSFVANNYMSYRYGWRPFLSDVKGFTNLSKRFDQLSAVDGQTRKVMKVSRSVESSVSRSFVGDLTTEYQCFSGTNAKSYTRTNTNFAYVQSNPSYESMSVANKFAAFYGLSDVASIAWELVPYSFVVDWFLPIGDTISRVADAPSRLLCVSDVWSCTKDVTKHVSSIQGLSTPEFRCNTYYAFDAEQTTVTRDRVSLPPPKPEIGVYQVADMLVMAGQKLGPFFGKSFRR